MSSKKTGSANSDLAADISAGDSEVHEGSIGEAGFGFGHPNEIISKPEAADLSAPMRNAAIGLGSLNEGFLRPDVGLSRHKPVGDETVLGLSDVGAGPFKGLRLNSTTPFLNTGTGLGGLYTGLLRPDVGYASYRPLDTFAHLGVLPAPAPADLHVSRYSLDGINRQIEEQRDRISDLIVPKAAHFPSSQQRSVEETNERLERIEIHFEQMKDILTNGALIANNIQGHASQFLEKFEKASTDNDRSAANAIRIGKWAVIIALLTPILQTIYSAYTAYGDKDEMRKNILEMKSEIKELRKTHIKVSERIVQELDKGDGQASAVLREIRDLLSHKSIDIFR